MAWADPPTPPRRSHVPHVSHPFRHRVDLDGIPSDHELPADADLKLTLGSSSVWLTGLTQDSSADVDVMDSWECW